MWVLFGLLSSLSGAVQSELNKNYKIGGFRLNTYRAFISTLFFIPFVGFIRWDYSAHYYFTVFIVAVLNVIGMMLQYDLSAKKNGRVACLHMPIGVVVTFLFWLCLDKSQLNFLMNNSLNLVVILIAFGMFGYAFQKIRKNDLDKADMSRVIAIAFLFSFSTIISKLSLNNGENLLVVSLNFVLMANLFMFIISFPIFLYTLNKRKIKITKQDMQGSLFISIAHTTSWVCFCMGVICAPNPAYIGVITGLIPVWFIIYYKVRKIQDNADPKIGIVMALSAMLIIIFGS